MISTTAAYLAVSNNLARQQAATAAQADVKADTNYYLAHIGKVTSPAALLKDGRLFSYAMTAFGLGDMVYAKGLMAKVLAGGVTDPRALANTLTDPRFRAFAAVFDFAGKGAAATQAAAATTGTSAKYVEQRLESDQAKSSEGVSNALYFARHASSITSMYGLLADPKILKVVETAYGISSTLGQSSIDVQAAVLAKAVPLADLQDAGKVAKIVSRYTAQYDAAKSGTVQNVLLADAPDATSILDAVGGAGDAPAGSVLALFGSKAPSGGGISSDTLLSLAKLSRGG